MNSRIGAAKRHGFAMSLATGLAFVAGLCNGAHTVAAASVNRQALRGACFADYQSLCRDTPPGGGRVIACMHQNVDKLSAACRNALANAKAARQEPQ